MLGRRRDAPVIVAVSGVAILAAVLVGVSLRLDDPQSTPVLAAEDPYNHMALVREHTRDGSLDPLNPDGTLYPPGMHALIAAAVAFSGFDLYRFMVLGPVLFGAIGILGVAFFLWRFEGPLAAVVGAAAFAVAPEVIVRTTMMAPTAVDLALLPFFLFSLIEIARGRLGWTAAAAPIALFFVFSHPWIVPVVATAGAAFAVLALVHPWPAARGTPIERNGVAIVTAILGLSVAVSLTGCSGYCGAGLREILPSPGFRALGPLVALLSVGLAFFLARGPPAVARVLSRNRPATDHLILRAAASAVIAAIVTVVTLRAVETGLPDFVDLPAMMGWPVLILAGAAFVALPFIPSPAAHVGFALSASTYPFVVFNPLQSEFWPHRTAVYLGLGLAMLAGVAAGAAGRFIVAAYARWEDSRHPHGHGATRPTFAVAGGLLVAITMAGTVVAVTPEPAEDWYRLYSECEFEGIRAVSAQAAADPETLVITGAWQPKLVLAGLTPDASRIWYKADFFADAAERDRLVNHAQNQSIPIIVVVEPYLTDLMPHAQTDFLNQDPWREHGAWCHREGAERARVYAYTLEGETDP